MEDSFQFIIESPQNNQGVKKRPRLVTSCDNCRLKKIKCLQPSPETKCEACRIAKIPCRFKDRERYFAERSRAIAGNNSTASYATDSTHSRKSETSTAMDAFSVASNSASPLVPHRSVPRSSSHSPKASGLATPDTDFNARYQAYPSDTRRSVESSHRHSNSVPITPFHTQRATDSVAFQYMDPNGSQISSHGRPTSQQSSTRPLVLLDPDRPERPNSTLMPHFIQTFFEHLGAEFAFLNYEDMLRNFWDQRLPPLMANCIAAMASRYSTYPELTVRGLHTVSETYLENAKNLLTPIAHIPVFDTLHALILLCWSEYKNNRLHSFRAYYQMVMKMAMELGLSDQDANPASSNDGDHGRRRSTWASIVRLHIMASQYRGQ